MEELKLKYDKKPIIGDIYTLSNLKIMLDDILNEYLLRSSHKRNYLYSDIKNIIGIISILLSSICCYLSMLYKYEIVKKYIALSVIIYFVINTISILIGYLEDGKFYYNDLYIKTRVDDVPTYIILVYSRGKVIPVKYNKSIFDLFDETGRMDHHMLLNDLENLFKK